MPFTIPKSTNERLIDEGKYCITNVNGTSIRGLQNWILGCRSVDRQLNDFIVVINSSGGSPGWVLDFASFKKTLSGDVKITGVAFGECGSAALALLQCFDQRIAVEHCSFFIHHIQTTVERSCQDDDFALMKTEIQKSREIEAELVKIQRRRSGISAQKMEVSCRYRRQA